MERQTWRRISLALLGIKFTGLLIYSAFNSTGSSGPAVDPMPTIIAVQSHTQGINDIFNELNQGIPMIGPKGNSILIRDPQTGKFVLVPATPDATPERIEAGS